MKRGTRRAVAAFGSLAILLTLVVGTFAYDLRATRRQQDMAVVADVAGRLRGDVERFVTDVLVKAQGGQADPAQDLEAVRATATALVKGGPVGALQGGGQISIPAPRLSPMLLRKLDQARALTDDLASAGERVLATTPTDPAHAEAMRDLRVTGALLSSVTKDIVGEITLQMQGDLRNHGRNQVLLAVLVAVVAVAMGLGFRRDGRARETVRNDALARHASDLVTVVDADGRIAYASPSAESVLGRDPRVLVGRRFADTVHPDDLDLVRAALGEVEHRPGCPIRAEFRVRHAGGRWVRLETAWTNLLGDPAVRGIVANGRDVTDRNALERELRRRAFRDDLTGLANRALFADRVEQAVARAHRSGGVVTVLFVDLDGFKTVNDSLGHSAGDKMLVAVAGRLQTCVRPTDTIARLGGDEFAVLMEDGSPLESGTALAERIIKALRERFAIDDHVLGVTASIGVASRRAIDSGTEELLRDADVAMYAAKAAGKGRYEVFAPHMHADVVERQRIGSDLQGAIERGEMSLHYQPLVRLRSGSVVGFEALLRWNHPTRGPVPPATFIPVAEETGAIDAIGAWVLHRACTQLAEWTRNHPNAVDMVMTVNVSPVQLARDSLAHDVRAALGTSRIHPGRLVLEITESAVIGDLEAATACLERLRELGVRVAIDDFGTGYSSLSQLQRLPIDMLKIDRSFVEDSVTTGRGRALLQSIVDLGRTLDLQVVAEGIEHPDQAQTLSATGSELGQGFWFAAPGPPEQIERLLAAGARIDLAAGAAASVEVTVED